MSLQSTIAGSRPKPPWLSTSDQLWAGWLHDGDVLAEAKRDAVRLAVTDQELAGLDIVSDGEQTRQHFVTTFIEGLEGVDAVNRATVTIRRRYEASVPRIVGKVGRATGVFVDDARYLRSITGHPIKVQLPGPMTMADTVKDEHYGDMETLARDFATVLNQEAKELEGAGVDLIQFDEPAFNVFLEEVASWGIDALEAATIGLDVDTAVHICYGYGVKANIDWKSTLGSEWRQYETTFPLLAASSIGQVSLEIAGSHVPLEVLDLLGDKEVQVGVIDVATDQIETPDEVAGLIEKVAEHIVVERIYPSTNCGMVPLSRSLAIAKMRSLGAGAVLFDG